MSSAPPPVAAIVLNWNGLDDTRAAVDSLLAQSWPRLRVHVIDNGSHDGEADRLAAAFGPRVELHRNAQNLGFAGGHEAVLRALLDAGDARYIALLNNDAVAAPDWIARLVAVAERNEDVGACASLMVYRDRPAVVENAGVVLLRTGEALPRGRGRPAAAFRRPAGLLAACGGALLLRADALRQVGLFRREFFLVFEDVDLTLRLSACGWRCRYVPDAVVAHRLGRSIDKVRDAAFDVRSIRNLSFAWLVNMPLPALLLSLPWLGAGWLLAPLCCALLGHPRYAATLLRGHLRALCEWRALLAARRALRPLRRSPWWRVFAMHGSSLAAYGRFLRDVVLLRRRAPMGD